MTAATPSPPRLASLPGWRDARGAAAAVHGLAPLAYALAGESQIFEARPTPALAAHLAALLTRHSAAVRAWSTGAQRRHAARLLRRLGRRQDAYARRSKAACAASGACWECHRAPAWYRCPHCGGTGRAPGGAA